MRISARLTVTALVGLALPLTIAILPAGRNETATAQMAAPRSEPARGAGDRVYKKVKKNACGMAMRGKSRDRNDADGADDDPDQDFSGAWQRLGACLRPLRKTWKNQGATASATVEGETRPVADLVRELVGGAMRSENAAAATARNPGRYVPMATLLTPDTRLREPIVRLAQLNRLHQPYSAMSQTGLARTLLGLAETAAGDPSARVRQDAELYRALAIASVRTVITPLAEGGLAATGRCAADRRLRCSWYNAITNTDRPAGDGGTLNKSLHASRDMLLMRERHGTQAGDGIDYDAAVAAAMNQLVFASGHVAPGAAPNMRDFLQMPNQPASWAYYGVKLDQPPAGSGYFLRANGAKNCRYHWHVLSLMQVIIQRSEAAGIAPEARAALLRCDSPLAKMYRATQLPVDAQNRLAGTTQNWCETGIAAARYTPAMRSFYQAKFSACPR